jgi:hypothetical protein
MTVFYMLDLERLMFNMTVFYMLDLEKLMFNTSLKYHKESTQVVSPFKKGRLRGICIILTCKFCTKLQ